MSEPAIEVEQKYDPSKVKAAGEGAFEVRNPFSANPFSLPDIDEVRYTELSSTATAAASKKFKAAPATGADALVAKAKEFVGTPYVWGGSSPLGFDCSGFTQYVFKQFGIDLPRVSYQQGSGGTAVNTSQMQPGDLVFWDSSSRNNGADHVAIYLGNGQIIAAPKPGDKVKIQSLYGNYFVRRYL